MAAWPLQRPLAWPFLAVFAALPLLSLCLRATAAEIPVGTFRYAVSVPTFGGVGTYANVISQDGDRVVVETQLRIAAKLMGMTLHRVEADRQEVWSHGRLQSYRSTTQRDGRTISVSGHTEGERFIIDGPAGRADAPASVRPGNPWSIAILRANPIMAAETGAIYEIQFSGGEEEAVRIGDRAVKARHYAASGPAQPNIWYDRDDIPVKFTIIDEGGLVTCSLVSASPPSVAARP